MQGIYKITNQVNGKIYIGKTNNSDRRWNDHKRLSSTPGHKEYDKILYKAMRKYGIENFTFEMIELLEDYSISGEREKYWISKYNSYNEGYNESSGGDGGSGKGHCLGSENGRAKLTEQDVIFIRTMYAKGCAKSDCYQKFKDKITESGFTNIWSGRTWAHIMPEVYTEENRLRNKILGKQLGGKRNRDYSSDEVRLIRQQRINGMSRKEAFELYGKGSFSAFQDLWYGKTYKEI